MNEQKMLRTIRIRGLLDAENRELAERDRWIAKHGLPSAIDCPKGVI